MTEPVFGKRGREQIWSRLKGHIVLEASAARLGVVLLLLLLVALLVFLDMVAIIRNPDVVRLWTAPAAIEAAFATVPSILRLLFLGGMLATAAGLAWRAARMLLNPEPVVVGDQTKLIVRTGGNEATVLWSEIVAIRSRLGSVHLDVEERARGLGADRRAARKVTLAIPALFMKGGVGGTMETLLGARQTAERHGNAAARSALRERAG